MAHYLVGSPPFAQPPLARLPPSSQGSADEQLYNEADLDATMEKIEVIDFFQTVNINGILVRGVKRCEEV